MKRTKHILYILFAALGVFVLASCMSDNFDDCNCLDDNGKLSLQILVPKSKVVTRATEPGEGNENNINSLRLYFFNGQTMAYNAPVTLPVAENADILLPVDAADENLFQGNVNYTVYAVANLDDDLTGKTLNEFTEHIVNKAIGTTSTGDFVMAASVVPAANLQLRSNNNRIGTFELKRVAVKIRMKLATFNMTGYTVGTPSVKLVNATDRGYLQNEVLPAGTLYSESDEINTAFGGQTSPFYSYPNFWTDDDNATYLHLTVPIAKQGQTEVKNYHYRVPINSDTKEIKSNHLYDITVTVNKLGSLDPATPAPIDAFFTVRDWGEENVVSEIKAAHYLMVAETYAEMKNIEEYLIDYSTSDPVEITNVKGQFIYVSNQTGSPVEQPATGDQIPQVTLQTGNKIKINSKIPVNYIPKKITFTVKHTTPTGIDPVEVTVWQYPPTFITHTTGTASSWRPSGQFGWNETHLKNKSIYRVTNLVPSELPEGTVLGFPPTETVSFYSGSTTLQHTDNITLNTEEVANMISPNFEMASQLGATTIVPYSVTWLNGNLRFYSTSQSSRHALLTCALYWEERVENGVTKRIDDWRLPTRAEIQLIDQMQAQGTAVTRIMAGKYYWSNLSNSAIPITKITPDNISRATASSAHVRCVRDVKEAPLNN